MKIAGVPIQGGGGGGATITKLTNQTLASGSWTTSGSYSIYSFSDASISDTSRVDFIPYNDSVNDAVLAELLPQVTTANGSCTLFASSTPTNNLIGDITIFTPA
jgi:hypothetical protein